MSRVARLALLTVTLLAGAPFAQASIITYTADLSGPAEFPPNASPGTGFASIDYDTLLHTLSIGASWSGLLGMTTAAHIHCCTAMPGADAIGVAVTPGTLPGFPLGVTSGTYMPPVIDLTALATYTASFVTSSGGTAAGAEAALIAGLDSGRAYFNIHSTSFPGGEIRGFLVVVPAPATLGLLAVGLVGLGLRRRVNSV